MYTRVDGSFVTREELYDLNHYLLPPFETSGWASSWIYWKWTKPHPEIELQNGFFAARRGEHYCVWLPGWHEGFSDRTYYSGPDFEQFRDEITTALLFHRLAS